MDTDGSSCLCHRLSLYGVLPGCEFPENKEWPPRPQCPAQGLISRCPAVVQDQPMSGKDRDLIRHLISKWLSIDS